VNSFCPTRSAISCSWLGQQLRDRQVLLEPVSQDQYERMVAVVRLEHRNINRELVSQGHAWVYRRYMRRSDRELYSLEDGARRQQAGLWAADFPHAPWEHRSTSGKR
jgi:endonuclease YncB( thermonuclease family)